MICEICNKNEGNIVFQVYNNGQIITHSICTECAMSAQNEFFKALNMLANKARQSKVNNGAEEKLPEKICPECGTVISNIDENSVFGCPHCYSAAREQLKTIKGMDTKNAEEQKQIINIEETLAELQHQLRTAIVTQDFERAAKLRDEINQTEKSMSSHGGTDE